MFTRFLKELCFTKKEEDTIFGNIYFKGLKHTEVHLAVQI